MSSLYSSHLTSLVSLQGRSRRNARRQLAVIRQAQADAAEAARLNEQAARRHWLCAEEHRVEPLRSAVGGER